MTSKFWKERSIVLRVLFVLALAAIPIFAQKKIPFTIFFWYTAPGLMAQAGRKWRHCCCSAGSTSLPYRIL